MADRKPDFYCVREIILGSRRWLRIPVEHRSEVGPWSTKEVGKALQFDTHAEACVELDKLRQYTGGKYSPRIVPVYVKVTRKPKLHDFAWALRRMRVGKRVRRSVWLPDFFLYAKGDPLLLFTVNDSAAALHGHDALATDWELAP